MSNLSAIVGAFILALIIVPIGFKKAVEQGWVTKKERKLTFVIAIPIYIIIIATVFYYS